MAVDEHQRPYLRSFELLEKHASETPQRQGLGCDGRWITYAEWWEQSRALAGSLSDGGQGPVGLLFFPADGIEFLVAYVACHLAGCPTVALNPKLTVPEREYQLDDAGVTRVLSPSGLRARATAAPRTEPMIDSYGDVMADIVYSSGTTGAPKGVLWNHLGLYRSGGLIARYTYGGTRDQADRDWELGSRDILVCALPVYSNSSACGAINAALVVGTPLHYLSMFEASTFTSTMRKLGGTMFLGVPAFYALWRDAEPNARPVARTYATLGAPVSTSLAAWANDRFGDDARFVNCYGLAESNAGIMLAIDDELVEHQGAIGSPVPSVDARIIDHQGRPSTAGELLLRTEGMMEGYLNKPEATAAALVDGWLHTGDIVVQEGFVICLKGRSQETINRGGYKILPREVEDLVTSVSGVLDAIAIGIPHPVLGEDIGLCVQIASGVEEGDVEREVRERLGSTLASFKVPRQIVLVREFPRNALGKVVRRNLKEWFVSRDN